MTDKQRLWLLELTGYKVDDYESGFVLHLDRFRVCIYREEVPFGVMGNAYHDLIGGWYKKIELIGLVKLYLRTLKVIWIN